MTGILHWIVELIIIDIVYEVSMISHYLEKPTTGHLLLELYSFKYIDVHKYSKLDFDP